MEPRIYNIQDGQQMDKAEQELRAKGLNEPSERFVDIIDGYFQANRNISVTAEAIVKLVEAQPGLNWFSAAQLEYNNIAAQNPQAAAQLAAWLNTHGGKPGQLVHAGDAAYENLTLLLVALQGREVSPTTIAQAEIRIANRPGKQLRRVPVPRRTEPVSAAAKEDDSTSRNWLGRDMVPDGRGGFRTKTYAEQARDREAAEAAKSQAQTQTQAAGLSAADQQWRSMAQEALRYGTHGEQAQITRVYDRHIGAGSSWRQVYEAVNAVRNQLKNKKEMLPA
jgi:hypothetical protein